MNNKGISVITLVVTIIVLVLITSITVYNGRNMIVNTRERLALDRVKAIGAAMVSHDEELGYGDIIVSANDLFKDCVSIDGNKLYKQDDSSVDITDDAYVALTEIDYHLMGLDEYADNQIPPTYVIKFPSYTNNLKKIYRLKSPKYVKKNGDYTEDEFIYYDYVTYSEVVRNNYKMEFDEVKGVNRPLLTEDMTPVYTYYAGDDYDRFVPTVVKDIYKESWYNYSTESPMWANVMMPTKESTSSSLVNRYYVWIPRFAYRIQDLYKGKNFPEIPDKAIEIVFLRGDTDYMPNDDVLSSGFQVHPAFKYAKTDSAGNVLKDSNGKEIVVNIPGFWVAKEYVAVADALYDDGSLSASQVAATDVIKLDNLFSSSVDTTNLESHLLKNTEWAAIAYLSMYTVGRSTTGNSLKNDPSGVVHLNEETFVAGGLRTSIKNVIPYADFYDTIDGRLTYYSFESSVEDGSAGYTYNNTERKFGDALCATSLNDGISSDKNLESGAWFEGRSIPIDTSLPFITRGYGNNLFSYGATSNKGIVAACRNVLIVTSK